MKSTPCWRCQTHVGLGALCILSGAILWATQPDRVPWVFIIGALVLAMFPVQRWIRHWVTESLYAFVAKAHRELGSR